MGLVWQVVPRDDAAWTRRTRSRAGSWPRRRSRSGPRRRWPRAARTCRGRTRCGSGESMRRVVGATEDAAEGMRAAREGRDARVAGSVGSSDVAPRRRDRAHHDRGARGRVALARRRRVVEHVDRAHRHPISSGRARRSPTASARSDASRAAAARASRRWWCSSRPRHLAYVLIRGLPIVNYRADVTLEPGRRGDPGALAQRVRHEVPGHRRADAPVPPHVPRRHRDPTGRTCGAGPRRRGREAGIRRRITCPRSRGSGDIGWVRVVGWSRWSARAVVLAGCRVPGQWFPGHGPAEPSGVHVVAPANRTQAPASGEVPLDVRLASNLDPTTLRVWVVAGWPDPTSTVEVTRPARARRDRREGDAARRRPAPRPADDQGVGVATRRERRRDRIRELLVGARGRPRDREPLRRDRGPQVPDAVPERLLHRAPTPRAAPAGACTSTRRRCRRTRPASRSTRPSGTATTASAPASMIVTYVPGLDLAKTGAAPITDIGASLGADQPIVLLDTEHRPAVAVLLRARQPGRPGRRRRRSSSGRPRTCPRVTASSWRCATCATATARSIPAERGFQLYRDRIPTFTRRSRPAAAHFEQVFDDARGTRASTARRPVPRVGLHGRERAEPRRADAPHPRRRVRVARTAARRRSRSPRCENNVDDRIFRRVTGTFTIPNYLTGDGAPGQQVQLRARRRSRRAARCATATFTARVHLQHPAVGRPPTATTRCTPARGGVYGHGLLGSNGRGERRQRADDVERPQLRVLRDEVGRLLGGRHRRTRSRRSRTSPTSRRSPTARSRASSTSCSSPACVKDPHGFASNPAFRPARAHTPVLDGTVVLRRQQPGRHPRRRA